MSGLKQDFGGFRGWLSELSSQARWFGFYTLPKALAKPFSSKTFCTIYSILLALFLLLSAASWPIFWRDFLLNILQDAWEEHIGAGSLVQGLQWLISLPSQLILLSLAGWGGLVVLWAGPRSRFLHCLEDAWRLPVVRSSGRRMNFLKHMNQKLNRGLAPGPKGLTLPVFIPTPEYDAILSKARTPRSKGSPKGLLISGPSAAGKTRLALELVADLNPPMAVIWQGGAVRGAVPETPVCRDFFVILADNLSLNPSIERGELPDDLHYLLQRCERALVAATVREEYLPKDVRSLEVFQLSKSDHAEKYRPLAEAVAQAEGIAVEQVLKRFDGFPGSLVAGLEVKRAEYDRLTGDERGFLQAAQLLWKIGVRTLTIARVWNAYQDLFGDPPKPLRQEAIVTNLAKKGFLTLSEE